MRLILGFIALALFAFASFVAVKHELWAYNSSGNYEGVIIQKAVGGGRGSVHYFQVRYDFGPIDTISVHPIDYKNKKIGDRWVTTVRYMPILGLSGKAYRPNLNGEPSFIMSLGYVSLKVFLIGCLFFYLGMLLWAVCRD